VETLAGAIVGSLNNILVAHIEGGEISGTVDELIRHSVSKLSHIHFVSNGDAAKRLKQMGEIESSIFNIGSPDIDIMFSNSLPSLEIVKHYYEIDFDKFAIVMFHPVTTEVLEMQQYVKNFVNSLLNDTHNYIVIYPNNDLGSQCIINEYARFQNNTRFRIFPSLRFEYFLTLLKNSQFIIGNSSAGIREAPYYGIPIINIGTRQQNRAVQAEIINVDNSSENISSVLKTIDSYPVQATSTNFGDGNSTTLFLNSIQNNDIWKINHQKQFRDN
jgi:UDP-N-acetylglucosamine 2-epimerase (hydrolysing)